jgi:hypothetical protein
METVISKKGNNSIPKTRKTTDIVPHFVPSRTFEVAMNDPFTLQKIARAKEILAKYPPPKELLSRK